jgi:D-xylonolactonase
MTTPTIRTLAKGFGLLEGPVWDAERGLLFADADFGGVYCLAENGQLSLVIPHRRGIGGMVLHEEGGLVVSGRNIAHKGTANEPTVVLFENDPAHGIVGFNDITTDAAGRIYVGSLGFLPTKKGDPPRPGALHVIDLDGSSRRLAEGVQLTNGMGFSPSGRLLYHADSGDCSIHVYDVASDGSVSDKRLFASIPEGLPDGIATADDGSVWVAVAHAGQVVVLNPDASVRERLHFPVPMVTSLCFGGDDLRTLYVVSGPEGADSAHAGTVFSLRAEVVGLPIVSSRVALKPT